MISKEKFLAELNSELKDLTDDERENAIKFYSEFLDDLTKDKEESFEITKEIGTPKQIAKQIKADLVVQNMDDTAKEEKIIKEKPYKKNHWKTLWIVILAIFALPIGVPIGIAVVCVLVAIIIVIASILIAFLATTVSLALTGLVAVIFGIVLAFSDFATSLFYIGGGAVLIGLSIIFGILILKLSKICGRGLVILVNKIRIKFSKNLITKKEGNNEKK